jgi:N-acetylneuraminate synthase/N,N'-diacetyllegionaminate synthase
MKINNSKCLIIAEIGLNHNGDHQSACDSVLAAVNSRLDAVKFQNFITEDFLTDRSILHCYKQNNEWITEPPFDICKSSEFKSE